MAGASRITVEATDGRSAPVTTTFEITVVEGNVPPEVVSGIEVGFGERTSVDPFEDRTTVEELLTGTAQRRVSTRVPVRGDKLRRLLAVLLIAIGNAVSFARR